MFREKRNTIKGFRARVAYAIKATIMREDSRAYDDCFEMYDGTAVVLAIMRAAEKSEDLTNAINSNFKTYTERNGQSPWHEMAEKYKHLKDWEIDNFAQKLRRKGEIQSMEMLQRLNKPAPVKTEPTEAGLQLVLDGCEKRQDRSTGQLDLWG